MQQDAGQGATAVPLAKNLEDFAPRLNAVQLDKTVMPECCS